MTEKNTLLIVDDYEFNRLILCDMFPSYNTIEVENGKQAIEAYEAHKDEICAVLSDIMMPEMDGFGLLEHFFKQKYVF
ncbi:MAG: response regulator, partial [Oscillospiraceae bacterium]|nr:response regulator [Oscillospiraceae bacterium]